MFDIYALFSTRDHKVRYVGLTDGSYLFRFKQHKRGVALGRFIPSVEIWMRGEWREGYPVECVRLHKVVAQERRQAEQVETEWMSKFPLLLNERKYRYCGNRPPTVPAIQEYKRTHRANCGGFRGVHWWGEVDRYSVLTESGEWLYGDSAPGWNWDIFFSDHAEALEARDRHRKRRGYYGLPDIEQEMDW